ncbi:MAG TPA: DNA-3-methyladenine glycosylase 2 family protein, partial [Planctomycetaceae bacterium]|nr:DNA-3-methyladenine glycosylase 2 family protein [Planctomycetaceae bacterium]
PTRLTTSSLRAGSRALAKDADLAHVIKEVGPCKIEITGGGFAVLARSILSQQISTKAARSIRRNLQDLLPRRRLAAAPILSLSDQQLQSAGISAQKRGYLRDLAERTVDGTLNFRRLARADEETVIDELTQVRGIGRWTAQMYLMFGLGRPDVFAPDDLGLQNAVRDLRALPARPSAGELDEIARAWRPWRTVAAWYLWRSLDGLGLG